jgi:hypothetical protein
VGGSERTLACPQITVANVATRLPRFVWVA